MYERSYGYRYRELGDHPSAADIAKAIRADIKQATAEGLLPARWSYSVRSDTYSGGRSVDVRVQDCADAWQACDGGTGCRNVWCAARNDPAYAHAAEPHSVLTEEAEAARMTLQRIHGAYNHDGSDLMTDYFDVRYYGHVEFESESSADFRRREKERLAARKQARETARPVALFQNYGRDGRNPVVHVAVETEDGRTVLACGARVSRRSFGRKLDLGAAPVTCSRCAKKGGAETA
jgi:hypothetical protein